jgi:serpin B
MYLLFSTSLETASCTVDETSRNVSQRTKLVLSNTKFALDLYLRRTKATKGNIFMSPLSISMALAMTCLGARNNTKSQMKDVMYFGEMEDKHLHDAFSDIQSSLMKPNQLYTICMANRLFGDKSYNFLEEFLSLGRKHYGAELAAVDFRYDSRGAQRLINNWVAENTHRKITNFLPETAVSALTRLILVNAIYFMAKWLDVFKKENTRETDFHVSLTETVKVQLMHQPFAQFVYGYNDQLNCQAIELPYDGGALRMFIILPDSSATNLSELERKLTVEALINVRGLFSMTEQKVHVWLPRFKLDEKLELADTLASMGMGDLFTDNADLSGLDGKKDLHVSEVLHRAVVEVNETGTVAAAATAVLMVAGSAWNPNPKDPFNFRADHPFLFFIQDDATKSVIFLGRVVKPDTAVDPSKDDL